jgi:hypothetical protein
MVGLPVDVENKIKIDSRDRAICMDHDIAAIAVARCIGPNATTLVFQDAETVVVDSTKISYPGK